MSKKKFVFHGKQVLLLGLVALVIAAGYYRWTVERENITTVPVASDALPVNAEQKAEQENKEGENKEGQNKDAENKQEGQQGSNNGGSLEKLKQERDAARSSAVEEWNKTAKSAEASQENKTEAGKKVKSATEYAEKEKAVETLVKSKGYEDCFAFISEQGVSVTVKGGEISGAKIAQIKDIVVSETGASVKDIKISAE